MVCATWDQCGKSLGWRLWEVAAVSGSTFDVTGEWATVGVLRDIMVELLCLMSTALICHSVMLYYQ